MCEDFGGCKGYVYQNNVSTYVNMPLDGCVVRTLFTTTFSLSGGVLGTWEGWHDFWATHMDVHEVCQSLSNPFLNTGICQEQFPGTIHDST